MATKSEKDKQKTQHDKNHMILSALLRDDDNKYCVDCDAKGWQYVICFWCCKIGSIVSAYSKWLTLSLINRFRRNLFIKLIVKWLFTKFTETTASLWLIVTHIHWMPCDVVALINRMGMHKIVNNVSHSSMECLCRPCLKHAGTPGRRRDSITGRDAGKDAGTVASCTKWDRRLVSNYHNPSRDDVAALLKPGQQTVQHHMLFKTIWRRANSHKKIIKRVC